MMYKKCINKYGGVFLREIFRGEFTMGEFNEGRFSAGEFYEEGFSTGEFS